MKKTSATLLLFCVSWMLASCTSDSSGRPVAGDGMDSSAEERAGLYYGAGNAHAALSAHPATAMRTISNPEPTACSPNTEITLAPQAGSPANQRVCGVTQSFNDRTITFYKGIPYADSTADDNRWRDPQPPQWTTLSAYEYGHKCPQGNGADIEANDVSEDCLYLNVWTPTITPAGNGDLPVMVFIHGGAFISGSGGSDAGDMPDKLNPYDGTQFIETAMTDGGENVVFVTMNYRLGVLGFLAGDEIGFDGNYGIKDQTAALEWVHRNISLFGGDPDRVMIFGESAGAQSTALHLTITANDHQSLFEKAVMESNYAIQYMDLPSAQQKATRFTDTVGCGGVEASLQPDCLRATPLAILLDNQDLGGYTLENIKCSGLQAIIPWNPVIDGTFITADPINSAITKPMMNGSNLSESIPFIAPFTQTEVEALAMYDAMMLFLFGVEKAAIIEARYLEQYPSHTHHARDRFEQVVTDYLWTCFNRKFASVPTETPVYRYHDIHHGSFSVWVDSTDTTTATYTQVVPAACYDGGATGTAVCHADELPFVFGNPTDLKMIHQTFTSDESSLSLALREYWIQFARNSDPNATGQTTWDINGPHGNILQIQAPASAITSVTSASVSDPANCDLIWDDIGYVVTSAYTCE